MEIAEADDGDEPDPRIGVTKYRLFVKGYRGESFVVATCGSRWNVSLREVCLCMLSLPHLEYSVIPAFDGGAVAELTH